MRRRKVSASLCARRSQHKAFKGMSLSLHSRCCPAEVFLHQTHKGDFKEGDQVAFMAVVRNGKVQAKDLEPAPPGSDMGMSPMGMGAPMGGPGPMGGSKGVMGCPMMGGDIMGGGKGGAVVVHNGSLDRSARAILNGVA